jgi:hypothetical protein
VAVPAFVMVAVALSLLAYVGSNFLATPTPTSFNTIFGSFSLFFYKHPLNQQCRLLFLLMNIPHL